jgi:hypothetical protein
MITVKKFQDKRKEMKRNSFITILALQVFLMFIFANAVFGAIYTYTFKSVRNERISYDPAYFNLGTFNDIIAAGILSDITASEAELILHTVKWTPAGGLQQEETLRYEGGWPGGQGFLIELAHDVDASSFPMWENIDYDFYIDGVFQPPPVIISSGALQELTTPTAVYDALTHVISWQTVESRNYKVRILGSTYQDDILFDSETIIGEETYRFTDLSALSLINSGAIIAVEARQFKSSLEAVNMSIYITKTKPFPDFDYDGDVDGTDLIAFSEGNTSISMEEFSLEFGKSASP